MKWTNLKVKCQRPEVTSSSSSAKHTLEKEGRDEDAVVTPVSGERGVKAGLGEDRRRKEALADRRWTLL